MDIRYFQDTDTLLVSFSDGEIVETRDVNENLLIELDADGKVVSVTIEHAGEHVDVSRFISSRDQSDGGVASGAAWGPYVNETTRIRLQKPGGC